MARGWKQGAADRWAERVERWDRSGLSVAEFCDYEEVSPAAFYQWRKRIWGDRDSGRDKTSAVFLPIEIVDAAEGASLPGTAGGQGASNGTAPSIEILMPDGVIVRVPAQADESQLRSVLRAVVAETRGC